MSIRTRLIWSFAAMLAVPLIVLLLTTLLMAVASHGDMQYYKKLYFSTAEKFDNDEQFHLLKELKRAEEQNPGILDDPAYLREIEAELNSDDSGIILRHGSQLTYRSDNLNHDNELLGALPVYQSPGIRSVSLNEKNRVAVVYQLDYSASPGVSSSFFIVTNVDPFLYWIRGAFPTLFTVLVVILILTHVLLTTFVSRSIIRPLHALRVSAKRIKEGDLDNPVNLKGKDEIGLLGQAFEEMRVQLKHSIRLQLQYEENRKELVSNISHDLKTPITTIRGYVDGIMDGVADTPEKSRKYMVTIADKAEEMDRLIDELFLYSKLDLNSVPFDYEPILLREFIGDWSDEMRFDLEKANVVWNADNRIPKTAIVMMDRDKFK